MRTRIFIVGIILTILLAACSTSKQNSVVPELAGAPMVEDRSYGDEGGVYYQEGQPMATSVPYEPSKLDSTTNTAVQDRMVIMNADVTIVIADPQIKMEQIAAMAESLGGFVVSMNMYQTYLFEGGTAPEGYISIRVPAEKMESALGQIKADVVEVRNENRSGQDVTASYVDLKSRLSALEAARDQLQAIMDAATKTEDVLSVFNQLQYYNEQIEMVTGQMKYYEEASAYSLINVTLVAEETIQPLEIGPWTPKGAAQDAYKALINFLRGFVEFVIWLFVVVLPILIIILGPVAVVIWLIVRAARRNKARKLAQLSK